VKSVIDVLLSGILCRGLIKLQTITLSVTVCILPPRNPWLQTAAAAEPTHSAQTLYIASPLQPRLLNHTCWCYYLDSSRSSAFYHVMAHTEEAQSQGQTPGTAEQSKSHHKACYFRQIMDRVRCRKAVSISTMSAQLHPQVPRTHGTDRRDSIAGTIANASQAPPENMSAAASVIEAAPSVTSAVAQTPAPQTNALQGYMGPICPADTRETVWGYSSSPAVQRPQGNRFAQNYWSFTMSGTIGSEAPHSEYFALDDAGRLAFDSAERLPFTMAKRPSAPAPKPASHAAILLPPHPAPASGPMGGGGVENCSNCAGTGSLKKFVTAGGNMRALCSDCVFDRCGGDQDGFRRTWAEGRPL
jgi:hypothetical protein